MLFMQVFSKKSFCLYRILTRNKISSYPPTPSPLCKTNLTLCIVPKLDIRRQNQHNQSSRKESEFTNPGEQEALPLFIFLRVCAYFSLLAESSKSLFLGSLCPGWMAQGAKVLHVQSIEEAPLAKASVVHTGPPAALGHANTTWLQPLSSYALLHLQEPLARLGPGGKP